MRGVNVFGTPRPDRPRTWIKAAAMLAVGLTLLVACSQSAPKGKFSPSPSSGGLAGNSLVAWKACGSDAIPPASLLLLPKLQVKVDASRTNGAVSQANADKWGRAFLREQHLENWAVTTNREAVLKGGCLGSITAYEELFAPEVSTMEQAKAAGGHLEFDPAATLTGIAIVPAPVAAADYVSNLSGARPKFAVVGTFQGPIAAFIVTPSGSKQELGHTNAGVVFRVATFGQFKQSGIGPLWFQMASADCGSAWMAGTCDA